MFIVSIIVNNICFYLFIVEQYIIGCQLNIEYFRLIY